MNGLVSVIIPVYGVSKYIDKCIDSVVSQTYRNLEIILVDDGGTDDCPRIIDLWASKDNRIVALHKNNGGQSSARNAGLDICGGEYITFVDGDDWLEKDYCEKLVFAIERFNSDISAAFFNRCYDDKVVPSSKFLNVSQPQYPCSPSQAVKYFIETSIALWGKLYKREILESLRLPEGRLAEEYEFQLNALLRSKSISFCNEHLYDYRIRSDSAAHSIKPNYLMDNIDAINQAYKICKESFQFEEEYCFKHLCALVFEFVSAKSFGQEILKTREPVLNKAIDVIGGIRDIYLRMEEPLDIIFYTYGQFHSKLTKNEKKTLQKTFRNSYKYERPKMSMKTILKYIPSFVSIEITTRLFGVQR